ncbi:MAG: hypothetical protein WHU94_09370, partial [Thermogemmata sp.]
TLQRRPPVATAQLNGRRNRWTLSLLPNILDWIASLFHSGHSNAGLEAVLSSLQPFAAEVLCHTIKQLGAAFWEP